MESLSFDLVFAIAAGALVLSLAVGSALSQRPDRRIPIRVRRDDR